MYAAVAAEHPAVAHFVDAGAAVLDHGRWTDRLPCLPVEPCEGGTDAAGRHVNVVRSPDGTHFCPIRGGRGHLPRVVERGLPLRPGDGRSLLQALRA